MAYIIVDKETGEFAHAKIVRYIIINEVPKDSPYLFVNSWGRTDIKFPYSFSTRKEAWDVWGLMTYPERMDFDVIRDDVDDPYCEYDLFRSWSI